jgi:hypothetical protein
MDPVNPLSGGLLTSAQAQRQASADNQRQVRRALALAKTVAARGDTVDIEHEVESSEGPAAVGDESPDGRGQQQARDQQQPQQPPHPSADQPSRDSPPDRPHIDLTA